MKDVSFFSHYFSTACTGSELSHNADFKKSDSKLVLKSVDLDLSSLADSQLLITMQGSSL